MVAVDYTDILSITLPYNRHHFDAVWIVTDTKTFQKDMAFRDLVCNNEAVCFVTDIFYRDGATFNKWAALEQGLDAMGRHGWICIADADVLWPKLVQFRDSEIGLFCSVDDWQGCCSFEKGNLYSPLRRMWNEWPSRPRGIGFQTPDCRSMPPENEWNRFPLHRNVGEFAGYSQIFHAEDPVLGLPPWHQVDWKHCGGADSFFQAKWGSQVGWKPGMPQQSSRKVRPPFEVLHLGQAGQNWYGRATTLADGSTPGDAAEKARLTRNIWVGRQRNRAAGRDQFDGERLG